MALGLTTSMWITSILLDGILIYKLIELFEENEPEGVHGRQEQLEPTDHVYQQGTVQGVDVDKKLIKLFEENEPESVDDHQEQLKPNDHDVYQQGTVQWVDVNDTDEETKRLKKVRRNSRKEETRRAAKTKKITTSSSHN